MPTVAVVSLKGGVGKTTVTLGLAAAAWQQGMRTLVVDLDPQANSTSALDPQPYPFTMNDVLADGREGVAVEAITVSGWGASIDLVPSETALEHRNIPSGSASAERLRTVLAGLDSQYDLILIDCPPSVGELTRNALVAADRVLVVTEPGYFALQGAASAMVAIDVVKETANSQLSVVGILANRVRPGRREADIRLAELRSAYPEHVLPMMLPDSDAIQGAQGAGVPIHAWPSADSSVVIDVFDDLLNEVTAT